MAWKFLKQGILLVAIILIAVGFLMLYGMIILQFVISLAWIFSNIWWDSILVGVVLLIIVALLKWYASIISLITKRFVNLIISSLVIMVIVGTIILVYIIIPIFFPTKTILDVMQPLSLLLTVFIGGLFLKNIEDRKKDEDRRKEREHAELQQELQRQTDIRRDQFAALDAYLDRVAEIIVKDDFRDNEAYHHIVQFRTLTTLSRVGTDDKHKLRIVIILIEEKLIERAKPLIDITDADLSKIDFSSYDSSFTDLNFSGANLRECNLSGKDFGNSDFTRADLRGSIFDEASLGEAILMSAKYEIEALKKARSLRGTILADGYVNQGDTLDERV